MQQGRMLLSKEPFALQSPQKADDVITCHDILKDHACTFKLFKVLWVAYQEELLSNLFREIKDI